MGDFVLQIQKEKEEEKLPLINSLEYTVQHCPSLHCTVLCKIIFENFENVRKFYIWVDFPIFGICPVVSPFLQIWSLAPVLPD